MVNYNIRITKMKLSHYWNFFGLLVSLTHLTNGQVVFDIQGTSCESHDITLGCTISSFTTNAVWKRDGSALFVTCASAGPCSQPSVNISGMIYTFQGNTSGIYMSTNLHASEHGMNWTCTYSGTDYIYQFELGCSTPSSEGPSDLAIAGYTILAVVLVAFLGFVTYIIVKKIIPEYCSSRSNDKPIVEETKAGSEFTLLPDLKEIRNIKKVTWRHEGKQVTIGNIKYNVRNLDDPSLIIGWISLDDSGKWQCELEINNQKQTKIIDIQLQVNVNTYNAAVGKKVQLLDYIKKSKDFLSVTWYHQNKEISTNEEKYQGGEILAPALVVCQLTKEDAGEYKCIIKFEDFTVAIPVKLDVQANPKLEPMA